MSFDLLDAFSLGLSAAWQGQHMLLLLVGCLIGLVVGALPGLGPASAMALLLPFTVHVSPLGALMLMAAIYYGAQYSGAATAIWTNVPGESSAAMTCHDGHPMALSGRGRRAQWFALGASFVAGSLGVVVLALASPLLVVWSYHFGPVEYVALLVVGGPFAVAGWLLARRRAGGRGGGVSARGVWAVAAVTLAFTVLRNLPWEPAARWLAP